jgi:hypothetical protein
MLRSTRASSSSATLAYATFSTDVGSSPICCTRLFAAAMGFRISCAMVDESSSMLACFSVCIAAFSRRTSRSTAGSKKRSFTQRDPNTPM